MKQYIMALDEGTTSCRAMIFDKGGEPLFVSQREFTQYFPKPGWVEHDAKEIFAIQVAVAQDVLQKAGLTAKDIAAIGITNQRESVVLWDKQTGEPIAPSICWQCRRSADICKELEQDGYQELVREKTGLILDSYFSATKVKWLLDQNPEWKKKAASGQILFGTMETFLIWKLTGHSVHITDYSNASRTMLFNIHTLSWDESLCDLLGIPMQMLPTVKPSSYLYGETDISFFGDSIPIAGAAGDQQAALFGQCCLMPGDTKVTYGTGGFLLMNTGNQPVVSNKGLLTTIAWGINGNVTYALEGSVFIAGAAVQWLRDGLRLIDSARDTEYMAKKVSDTDGCYIVPAFTGLGAPYWEPNARGTIVGLTRGTNQYHLIRATLESMAYQTYDVLTAMETEMGQALTNVRVDGGACANDLLVQFQADVTNANIERPTCVESTARGAVFLAGLAVGFWKDIDEICQCRKVDCLFTPSMTKQKRAEKLDGWKKAISCSLTWAN